MEIWYFVTEQEKGCGEELGTWGREEWEDEKELYK